MERGSITKWLLFGLAIYLLMTVGMPKLFPSKAPLLQPYLHDETAAVAEHAPEATCSIDGARFQAELSSDGASLRHFYLKDKQYTRPSAIPSDLLSSVIHLVAGDGKGSMEPADLVSTTKPSRSPLRVDLRLPGYDGGSAPKPPAAGAHDGGSAPKPPAAGAHDGGSAPKPPAAGARDAAPQQVPYDDLEWKLAASDGKSCTFTYEDAATSLKKVVSLGDEPFELAVDVTVKNLAPDTRKHRFTIEQTSYRTKKEMEGHLGRQSELVTRAVAITASKSDFVTASNFEPGDFTPKNAFTPESSGFTSENWRRTPGAAKIAAVSSVYFTKLVIPEGANSQGAEAETFVEEVWNHAGASKEADPSYGYVFRARLAYPEKDLAPGETAHYRALSFAGPKERDLLARIDHGHELLELGVGWTSFATKDIARGLVWYLLKLHGIVGSWGWAIVLLTISVRTLLFPLSLSQIKNGMAMRKLKPEMDVLNEKYKDDATQKGVAIQELWRKNGVSNPVVGCAPMLLQMPVWWALYGALQTAVELYHTPFGPVIPDLSAPGRYLIIPIVLGASSFLQQKLMPAQGDPQQQKMMMYMMPAIFTFMMLFLPAGLGVYMVTNSVLAIGQQLLVERYLKRSAAGSTGPTGQIEVREKTPGDGGKPSPALGKGKVRARG